MTFFFSGLRRALLTYQTSFRMVSLASEPGETEIDSRHAFWRSLDNHPGELNGRLTAMPDIGMVVGQLVRLFGDGLRHVRPAVADIDAIQAGKGVQAPIPVTVDDMDAVATGHDSRQRVSPGVLCHMR